MRRRLTRIALLALTALSALPAHAGAWAAPKKTEAATDERPLPFLSDDYAGALAEARARQLPLFIEAWAPW